MELGLSFFKELVERMDTPIVALDEEARVILFNRGMENLTGYSASEMMERNYLELFIPYRERDALRELFKRVLRGEETSHINTMLTRHRGRRRIEWHSIPMGKGIMVGIGKDVTEDVLARERLSASEKVLSSLVESIPGMVYRCYPNTLQTFILVSGWAEKITGYTPEELTQSAEPSHLSLVHPKDVERVRLEMERSIAKGRVYWLEYRLLGKDGTQRDVLDTGTGVWNDDNSLIELNGVIMDRSEHAQLKQRHRFLEQMVMSSPLPMIGLDAELRVVVWNRAASTLFGHEMEGEPISALFSERDAKRVEAAAERAKELGGVEPFEVCYTNAHGKSRRITVSAEAIRDVDGEFMGIRIVATEPMSLEGGTRHVKVGMSARCPPKDTDGAEGTKNAVELSGRQHAFESVSVEEVIDEALELVGCLIRDSCIHVSVRSRPMMPVVYANKNQLKRALVSLLTNCMHSLNAMYPEPSANKSIELELVTTKDETYVVTHIDVHGVGIPRETLDEMFEPLLMVAGSHVCDGALLRNGGYIKAEIDEGAYTRIKLILPSAKSDGVQK